VLGDRGCEETLMNDTHNDALHGREHQSVHLTGTSHAQMERFRSSHNTSVLTILLSDLEGSTRQQSELGNIRAAQVVQQHRAIFRE